MTVIKDPMSVGKPSNKKQGSHRKAQWKPLETSMKILEIPGNFDRTKLGLPETF
jgi:hypothetical protein